MFNYYQPHLIPFLKSSPNLIPKSIKQIYYYSFEDGLWDLLLYKFPNKKVKFLVPDFYCSDVLDNIRRHGHEYIYYALDQNFQISTSAFRRFLWLNNPDIVIVFHACGITSNLFLDTSWLSDLPDSTILIEDSVHRLVNPQKIKILNSRHLIIDSLRKVSPLPGSRIFGDPQFINFVPNRTYNLYFFQTIFLYFLFRLFYRLGFINLAHQYILKHHDDLIGDEYVAQKGIGIIKPIISRINYSAIEKVKRHQVLLYEKYFTSVYKNRFFYKIKISKSDYPLLHVYPLGIKIDPTEHLVTYLNNKGFHVWYKFTDSPWSETRRVLFLPLGYHIREADIKKISAILSRYV